MRAGARPRRPGGGRRFFHSKEQRSGGSRRLVQIAEEEEKEDDRKWNSNQPKDESAAHVKSPDEFSRGVQKTHREGSGSPTHYASDEV